MARGGPDRPADRRLPDRLPRPPGRPEDAGRQGPLRRRDRADAPGDPEPGHARRLPPDDPHAVRDRGAARSSRSSTGGPQAAIARPGRITADAVLASADALPVDQILPLDHAGRGGAAAADPARPGAAAPRRRRDRARTSCRRRRPASSSGRSSCQRAPNDQGIHPPFSMSALMAGLDDETRAIGPGDPRPAVAGSRGHAVRIGSTYAVDRCLLQLERQPPRRAGRLGRRRDPRRRGPRASATSSASLLDLQRQNNEIPAVRGPPDRTGHRPGACMNPRLTNAADTQLESRLPSRHRRALTDG